MRRTLIQAALVLLGGTLVASPHIGAQQVERPLIGVAGGGDIRTASPNIWIAQASAQWRERASGLGVRAELSYIERGRDRASFYPPMIAAPCPFPGCTGPTQVSRRSHGIGASIDGTYEFVHEASVRPYVISGIGLLATQMRTVIASPPPPCPACLVGGTRSATTLESGESDERLAATLNGGAGVVFDVGWAHLFTELRYQLSEGRDELALTRLLPLTFGVRF